MIDHEPPIRLVTRLARHGIKWKKGQPLKMYRSATGTIDLATAPDEIKFAVDKFNDKVITPFDLVNVQIDFLPHEKEEYDKLTRRAAVLFQKAKVDAEADRKLKFVLQKRAGVSAQARMRIPVAARVCSTPAIKDENSASRSSCSRCWR